MEKNKAIVKKGSTNSAMETARTEKAAALQNTLKGIMKASSGVRRCPFSGFPSHKTYSSDDIYIL
ncbi:MAG: hypothetical protein IJN68_06065 [Clostridia bacterium]|nr:hypothetical protein [Clostridia bacterium]